MSARDANAVLAAEVLDLIEGKWTTQAIGVAAELGIADLVASGTATLDALAAATQCEPSSLRRLMRALASLGLVAEGHDRSYALTARGELLREDAQPSLRAWARWGASQHWSPWGQLLQSVRTGRSLRASTGEAGGYDHLQRDPAKAAIFNKAMTEVSSLVAGPLLDAFDFGARGHVMDVGGGHGELMRALLQAHPRLQGTIFDLAHAIEGARSSWETSPLAPRCRLSVGDFFEAVPGGADVYVMKSILHNWDDGRSALILRSCREAAGPDARLLLVERVMPERMDGRDDDRRVARADLNMLVTHAGHERTLAEFSSLLGGSGFEVVRCRPLAVGFSLIEALPARRS